MLTKNVMLFSRKYCPFTYWLNGRWFLQIVDRDSGNLYPLFPCSDFYLKCGGGLGGGGYFFLAFYAISYIFFHLMFSWCFFMLDLFPTFKDFLGYI